MSGTLLYHGDGRVPVPHPDCDCEQCMADPHRPFVAPRRPLNGQELQNLLPRTVSTDAWDPALEAQQVSFDASWDAYMAEQDAKRRAQAQSLIDGTEGRPAVDCQCHTCRFERSVVGVEVEVDNKLDDEYQRAVSRAFITGDPCAQAQSGPFKKGPFKSAIEAGKGMDNGASLGSGSVPKRREPTEEEKAATQAMDRAISRSTSVSLSSKRIGSWHQPWVP